MVYSVELNEKNRVVIIRIKGRINYQIAEQYSKEAVKLAHKNNCIKYLIDHTETSKDGNLGKIHSDGDALQQFGFRKTDKIAVIISNLTSVSDYPSTENQSSLFSVIKYFTSDKKEEALNWLLETE